MNPQSIQSGTEEGVPRRWEPCRSVGRPRLVNPRGVVDLSGAF